MTKQFNIMSNPEVKPPNDAKLDITIQKPSHGSGANLFDGLKLNIQKKEEPPAQTKPVGFSIEKKSKSADLKFTGVKIPDFNDILTMMDNEGGKKFTRESKGYIKLTNLIKNASNIDTSQIKPIRHYHGPKEAKLNLKDANRFMPQSQIKAANLWEEDSAEAFRYVVNMILNRLTEKHVESTIEELEQHIKDDSHRKDISEILFEKVQREPAFSNVYAQFTTKLSDDSLREEILKKSIFAFEDYLCNTPTSEDEGIYSNGTARFIASLINTSAIPINDGLPHLSKLLDRVIETKMNPYLIEMLEIFFKFAGKDFMKEVDASLWAKFQKINDSVSKNTRLGCLLMNIDDLREELADNHTVKQAPPVVHEKVDDPADIIRSYYCDFCEGTDMKPIPHTIPEYLPIALHQLPDHVRDAALYGLFVAISVNNCQKSNTHAYIEITDALKAFTAEIRETQLDKECPSIWQSYYNLLVACYIFNRFNFNSISDIFPERIQKSDWINDSKYFIYDNFDFTRGYTTTSKNLVEINDAMSMPDTIDSRTKDSPMSRLVAIAICRTVINKAFANIAAPETAEEKFSEIIQKYSTQLQQVYQKYQKVFDEEFDPEGYEFPIPLENIISLINV